MPVQAQTPDADDDSGKTIHKDLSNGFTQEAAKSYTERAENIQKQIDLIMEAARLECQPFRDDLKELKKEAAERGFAKKPFAASLQKRRLEVKAARVSSKLSDDQRDMFDQIAAWQEQLPLPA